MFSLIGSRQIDQAEGYRPSANNVDEFGGDSERMTDDSIELNNRILGTSNT